MLKIDRVISVSSEDPAWPADNLLKEEGKNSKWMCKTCGERSVSVVLQLSKASKIKAIDVGNKSSAFIEILVGKSCLPDDSYKVLLVASSLMTLKEAKDMTNTNGVRFFKAENFCKPEADEKWDRVKIVCSQPYNKYVQFGLSFVKFHGESDEISSTGASSSGNKVTALGRFLLKEEKEDEIAVGSIFSRRKELQEDTQTSAVAIRAATSQLLSNKPERSPAHSKKTPNKASPAASSTTVATPNSSTKKFVPKELKVNKQRTNSTDKKQTKNNDSPRKNNDMHGEQDVISSADDTDHDPTYSPDEANESDDEASFQKALLADANQHNKRPRNCANGPEKKKAKHDPDERKVYKPFCEFMGGVVFTISGFQNPLRGDIRRKALEMGAKYKPDWDNTCTHLVCAFANTPKFNQVRGHGKIVKKEWIEQSYSRRTRLPWRRFALDSRDSKKPESEDEIFEKDETESEEASTSYSTSRDSNAQDKPGPSLFGDIIKAKNKKAPDAANSVSPKKKTSKASPVKNQSNSQSAEIKQRGKLNPLKRKNGDVASSSTVYLDLSLEEVEGDSVQGIADTESDQDWLEGEESSLALPYLPEQFYDLSFYVADDFPSSMAADLKRYIVAHSGSVQESCTEDTEYVIADVASTVDQLKEEFPQIIGVKAEWVWRCHDENRLLPTSNFEF